VERLKSSSVVCDRRIEAAFRAVPRRLFPPDLRVEEVCRDEAIVTKRLDAAALSSSSQPSVMAIMLEQLAVRPGDRVLEIGTGTGHNAALLAHLVGDAGTVVSVDVEADVADAARKHLADARFERVEVVSGDGGLGYAAAAPYDRIILTVGAWDIAPAWWDQLRAGGRLVLPLALRGPELQRTIAFDRVENHLVSVSAQPCGFIPLRGAFAGPIQQASLGQGAGLRLFHERAPDVDAEALLGWLRDARASIPTQVFTRAAAVADGLSLWVALHEARFCGLFVDGTVAHAALMPTLYAHSKQLRFSCGLLGEHGLALLGWVSDEVARPGSDRRPAEARLQELEVCSFGSGADLAERLRELVSGWNAAGRPASKHLLVQAYRHGEEPMGSSREPIIKKNWTSLLIQWLHPAGAN